MRRQRGKVVYGRFRRERRGGGPRVQGLPPELSRLLEEERKRRTWRSFLPVWSAAVVVGLVVGAGPTLWPQVRTGLAPLREASAGTAQSSTSGIRSTFSLCHTGGGYNCVVDGDTIWLEGRNIRVADIDAPETHEPRCAFEKTLGDRATRRLQQLVNSGAVTVQSIDRDEDTYGRKLRIVLVDGKSVGDSLVSEGLARWYAGGRRPWC